MYLAGSGIVSQVKVELNYRKTEKHVSGNDKIVDANKSFMEELLICSIFKMTAICHPPNLHWTILG